MPVAAIMQLVMMLLPEVLKLIQDLKDGRYDGDGGANQMVEKSKELVKKFEEEKKKSA
jgi:peptide subunit release factor 1 (eRF1)